MTGYDEVENRLAQALEMLENINLEQVSAEPKRAEKLAKALREVKAALEAAHAWQSAQQSEDRLAALLKESARYTATAHERLAASEARLAELEEAALAGRATRRVPDPKITAEGVWLQSIFAGPTSDTTAPKLLKDAPRVKVVAPMDALANALAARLPATAVKSAAKP